MQKRKTTAFNKDIYLLGADEEGTYYCDKCKKDTYHIESVCDICQEG
jgi:thioredoxin-related protein